MLVVLLVVVVGGLQCVPTDWYLNLVVEIVKYPCNLVATYTLSVSLV